MSEIPRNMREIAADHTRRYLASNGEDGAMFNGVPCVLMTTTGARSGATRYQPVVRVPIPGTEEYIVVGSVGGAPKNPSWYHNLLAHPDKVTIQDGATKRAYSARLAEGDERAELWAHAVEVFPSYAEYQTRTDRVIPVFRMTPIDAPPT